MNSPNAESSSNASRAGGLTKTPPPDDQLTPPATPQDRMTIDLEAIKARAAWMRDTLGPGPFVPNSIYGEALALADDNDTLLAEVVQLRAIVEAVDPIVGYAMTLDREQWGHVIDGLISLKAEADARQRRNSESTSGERAHDIEALILAIGAADPLVSSPSGPVVVSGGTE